MNVTVNGETRAVERGTTLEALVADPRGVAVALNGAVVPASAWAATALGEHDAVEVVTAHQGG
jgi:sulfur carrier protein